MAPEGRGADGKWDEHHCRGLFLNINKIKFTFINIFLVLGKDGTADVDFEGARS